MKASHDATGRGLHPAAARGKLGSNAAPGIVTVSNLQLLNAPIGIQPRLEARALFRGDERRDGAAGQQAGEHGFDTDAVCDSLSLPEGWSTLAGNLYWLAPYRRM